MKKCPVYVNHVSGKKRLMPKEVKQSLIIGSLLVGFSALAVLSISHLIVGGM